MPYHRHDQPSAGRKLGFQRHDSYPVLTPDGQEIVINPFDYAPFDEFDPADDGYDVTVLRDGLASVGETRDGGGLATTFFGAGCRPYGGWVFFPEAALGGTLITPGDVEIPIKGVYWEESGEAWPGRCPSVYRRNSLTSWEPMPGFAFGGIGGAPRKTIDAIRSIHGFADTDAFRVDGSLEIFYFTRLYGLTRWEAWRVRPAVTEDRNLLRRAADASERCAGPAENTYRSLDFLRTDCRDWSAVELLPAPELPPPWPIPALNLLRNFHFADGTAHWARGGGGLDWAPQHSAAAADTRYAPAGAGLAYLAFGCARACAAAMLYQDVPVIRAMCGKRLALLATLRTESGPGAVALRITALDSGGVTLAEAQTSVDADDGEPGGDATRSIMHRVRSFVLQSPWTLDPRTRVVRVALEPRRTGTTFDVTDVWLMTAP